MTEFWPGDDYTKPPVTTTFGSGLEANDAAWHERVGDANNGLRALGVLLLRSHAPDGRGFQLDGELAVSLSDIRRELNAKGNEMKPTWLQNVLHLKAGTKVPNVYLKVDGSERPKVRLGGQLQGGAFAVFIHETVAGVLGARNLPLDQKRSGRGSRTTTQAAPVPPEQYTALADELEGEVVAALRVAIQKGGRGEYFDPEALAAGGTAADLLPLRSGDTFQLRVTARPKAFLYLVWIDSVGAQTPLFPWSPEKGWDDPTADSRNQPHDEITLPDGIANILSPDAVFESWGEPGAETFVLLAHRQRLDLLAVRRVFAALPPPSEPPQPIAYRFADKLDRFPLRRNSDATAKRAEKKEVAAETKRYRIGRRKAPDRLDELHDAINNALHFRVDAAVALVVPSLGDSSNQS